MDYDRIITIESDCVEALFERGCVYIEAGRLRKALSDLNRVIKLEPEIPDAYVKRGQVYVKKGNKEKALKNFQIALDIYHKESSLDEENQLKQVIEVLKEDIKKTPWWQKHIF